MSAELAKFDEGQLSEFQKIIHKWPSDNQGGFRSHFVLSYQQSSWYSLQLAPLRAGGNGSYTALNSLDRLLWTYRLHWLPKIVVKDEYVDKYQICWTHNIGTNLSPTRVLKCDEETIHEHDSCYHDIVLQNDVPSKVGIREAINVNVGNIPYLENWSTELPAYPITISDPWFYAEHRSKSFPLYLLSSQSTLTHFYTFRENIVDLLRMRKKDGEKWVDLETIDTSVLNGIPASGLFQPPEVYGWYAYMSEKEKENDKCDEHITYYIEQVLSFDSPNPVESGAKAEINISSQFPLKGWYRVAENQTAVSYHNFSNYSTNSSDVYRGHSPVVRDICKQGTYTRYDLEGFHMERMSPLFFLPSIPIEPGYGYWPHVLDKTVQHAQVGLVPDKFHCRLETRLGNTDPKLIQLNASKGTQYLHQNLNGVSQNTKDRYIVHIRAPITRPLHFQKRENGTYVAVIGKIEGKEVKN